jgi:hypothetical protein
MSRLLPDSGTHSILIASGLGAASSSCSYAASALARSLFRNGAGGRAESLAVGQLCAGNPGTVEPQKVVARRRFAARSD